MEDVEDLLNKKAFDDVLNLLLSRSPQLNDLSASQLDRLLTNVELHHGSLSSCTNFVLCYFDLLRHSLDIALVEKDLIKASALLYKLDCVLTDTTCADFALPHWSEHRLLMTLTLFRTVGVILLSANGVGPLTIVELVICLHSFFKYPSRQEDLLKIQADFLVDRCDNYLTSMRKTPANISAAEDPQSAALSSNVISGLACYCVVLDQLKSHALCRASNGTAEQLSFMAFEAGRCLRDFRHRFGPNDLWGKIQSFVATPQVKVHCKKIACSAIAQLKEFNLTRSFLASYQIAFKQLGSLDDCELLFNYMPSLNASDRLCLRKVIWMFGKCWKEDQKPFLFDFPFDNLFFGFRDCTSANLEACNIENLLLLDCKAFIYLSAISYMHGSRQHFADTLYDVALTAWQEEWWKAVHLLMSNKAQPSQRLILQQGLEVLRLRSKATLPIQFVFEMANMFQTELSIVQNEGNEKRSLFLLRYVQHIWQCLCKFLQPNFVASYASSDQKFLPSAPRQMTKDERSECLRKCDYFMSLNSKSNGQHHASALIIENGVGPNNPVYSSEHSKSIDFNEKSQGYLAACNGDAHIKKEEAVAVAPTVSPSVWYPAALSSSDQPCAFSTFDASLLSSVLKALTQSQELFARYMNDREQLRDVVATYGDILNGLLQSNRAILSELKDMKSLLSSAMNSQAGFLFAPSSEPPAPTSSLNVTAGSRSKAAEPQHVTASEATVFGQKAILGVNQSQKDTPVEMRDAGIRASQSTVSIVPAAATIVPQAQVAKPSQRTVSECSEQSDASVENVDIYFEPLIPLPEEVALVTGEEDETVLFRERARLFRWAATHEWKERGTGELKLLEHKTSGKCRVLMRQEQTHKICANHSISSISSFLPHSNKDNVWTWLAIDFADEEMKNEQFCARFKTKEIAEKFASIVKSRLMQTEDKQGGLASLSSQAVTKSLATSAASNTFAFNTSTATTTTATTTTAASLAIASTSAPASLFKFNNTFSFLPTTPEKPPSKQPGMPAVVPAVCLPQANASTSTAKSDVFKAFSFKLPADFSTPKASVVTSSEGGAIKSVEKSMPNTGVVGEISARAGSELKTSPKTGSVFGQSFGASALTFEQLSQTPVVDTKPFKTSDKFGGFAGAGSTLFASYLNNASNKGKENVASADDGNADDDGSHGESSLLPEEFEPSVEFKAAIPLPNLIDVTTGEENEEVKFCEKAKLYRFDDTTGEFKERGAGDLKILYDRAANRHRIVMRREQVLKLCANHVLTSAMNLLPMAKSDKAFTWICQDFSDGALRPETLAARFKTKEIALRFKEHFEAAVQSAAAVPSAVTGQDDKPPLAQKSDVAAAGFGAQFLPKPGSWECSTCYIRNTADKLCCDCCGTAKDGATIVSSSATSTSSGIFKAMPLTTTAPTLGSSPFKFGFGSTPLSTVVSSTQAPASGQQPAFSFGFSSSASPTPHSSATAAAADLGKPLFTTTLAFGESSKSQHAADDGVDEGASELYADDGTGDHIHFEPLISLPLQDVKSGEEEEDILYCQRAKLFRFCKGEWKERGVGEFKLLKHRETGKVRALMRRDQTLKVCCNHLVTPQMAITQRANDNRCYIWNALDFSENCEAAETFAIRFKNEQLASEFRSAFEAAIQSCTSQSVANVAPRVDEPRANATAAKSSVSHSSVAEKLTAESSATTPEKNSDDDVQVIWPVVTLEQIERARKFQLPDLFYAYEQKSPCPGCRGCNDEVFEFSGPTDKESVARTLGQDFDGSGYEKAAGAAVTETKEVDSSSSDEEDLCAVFEKRATFLILEDEQWKSKGVGLVSICTDKSVDGGYHLFFKLDNGVELLNHVIALEYNVVVNASKVSSHAEWSAWDFCGAPERKTCRLLFSSVMSAQEFAECFRQGIQFAKRNDLCCFKPDDGILPQERMPPAFEFNRMKPEERASAEQ